jgi:serine/threonine protein kinase
MPVTNLQETPESNAFESRLNRLETAWLAWKTGDPMPNWRQHLPADEEPCSPDLVFFLLQTDIRYRIKAGLHGLLAERHFEHPRLQREDARLSAEQRVELIRWEYQQRWQKGDPARRAEYEAAFPQHASFVRGFKPHSRCPRCRKVIVLEETQQTRYCPDCGSASSWIEDAPPAGLDLRSYELIEELGKGGMGAVYRCYDPALRRDLAIKVMKFEDRGIVEAEHRFLREARITGLLQHPGIVSVHNLGRLADGRLHYTMRLVHGRTFTKILNEEAGNPARLPYLLAIFEKICQAVAYAHSKRVIHRDLKPHNVMVGRFGEVQVMDWGLAKVLTAVESAAAPEEMRNATGTRIHTESADMPIDLTRTGAGMGTPAYMPPEQALGEWDEVDQRADVFALGSILCEILTGQPAYSGPDGNEKFRRAKRGDVAETRERLERCDADAALKALCRECLTPKREDRPIDADALAERVVEYHIEQEQRLRRAESEREVEYRIEEEQRLRREELDRVAAEARAQEEYTRGLFEQQLLREQRARREAELREQQRASALPIWYLGLLLFILLFYSFMSFLLGLAFWSMPGLVLTFVAPVLGGMALLTALILLWMWRT